jgi:hypothetical protein
MFNGTTFLPTRQRRLPMLFLVFAALSMCLLTPRLMAQTDTGSIAGTASDATGAVIQGANVAACGKRISVGIGGGDGHRYHHANRGLPA